MSIALRQNTAAVIILGPFVSGTDGVTPVTNLTAPTALAIWKNGTSSAINLSSGAGHSWTHRADGYYEAGLAATDVDTLGRLKVEMTSAAYLSVWETLEVMPAAVWDALYGEGFLPVNLALWNAGALPTIPPAAPSAVQVRQEMDSNSTKLVHLDADVSSRLAASAYTAPDNVSISAAATYAAAANTKLPTDTAIKMAHLDADVSSRLPAGNVTVGTNLDKGGYSLAADQSGVTVGTVNTANVVGIVNAVASLALASIADAVKAVNVDSTGHQALTLQKAIELLVARAIGNASYDISTCVNTIMGRDGVTPLATVKLTGSGNRSDSTIA